MPFLPTPFDDETGWLTTRQMAKARRAQSAAELELFRYGLTARLRADMDRLDSQAITDASREALDLEIDLLDYGMARAGQSATKLELVRRRVELVSNINSRRIARRFGG